MTQRLTPDRLAELRDAPRHLLWGSEIAELFAHIDAVEAELAEEKRQGATDFDALNELYDARAELAALTTLRPISELRREHGDVLVWIARDGKVIAQGVGGAGAEHWTPQMLGATHWTPLFTPSLPKPVTPA